MQLSVIKNNLRAEEDYQSDYHSKPELPQSDRMIDRNNCNVHDYKDKSEYYSNTHDHSNAKQRRQQ